MNALSQMIEAAAPAGLILDLQVIRPDPFVELDGEVVARIDGEELFAWADTATAAVALAIAAYGIVLPHTTLHSRGSLPEHRVSSQVPIRIVDSLEGIQIRKHYSDGADLVEDVAGSKRRLPDEVVPLVQIIDRPLVVRESCRLRGLRVVV